MLKKDPAGNKIRQNKQTVILIRPARAIAAAVIAQHKTQRAFHGDALPIGVARLMPNGSQGHDSQSRHGITVLGCLACARITEGTISRLHFYYVGRSLIRGDVHPILRPASSGRHTERQRRQPHQGSLTTGECSGCCWEFHFFLGATWRALPSLPIRRK